MLRCPSCGRLQKPRLLCEGCQAPLPAELDYFTAFGLPRRLRMDQTELTRTYHELGRALHPDRFANASAEVRLASLRATALLTRAYRTLRDPAGRATYWLELHGEKLAQDNQRVPAPLAELVFATQEELAELRASAASGAAAPEMTEARAQVETREAEVAELINRSAADLEGVFGELDAQSAPPAPLIARLKTTLAEGAYLGTLRRDLRKALDSGAQV